MLPAASPSLPQSSSQSLVAFSRKRLISFFWVVAGTLLIYEGVVAQSSAWTDNLGACLITIVALIPGYYWCIGKAQGLPILPLFTLTTIWTYALPLVSDYKQVSQYSAPERFTASLTITAFLVVCVLVWSRFLKPPTPQSVYRVLNPKKGSDVLLWVLALRALFEITTLAGWISFGGGTFALIRGSILALSSVAVFVLFLRLGQGELSKTQKILALSFLIITIVSSFTSFLLVSGASLFLIATIAYITSSHKIPVTSIVIVCIVLMFLHYGKGDMRAKYWNIGTSANFSPWQYPSLFIEWSGYSIDYLSSITVEQQPESRQSFVERSSLMQIFLLAQTNSPQRLPHLNGATYAILPELLVPRIFNPNKIRSHEGTYILNVYYGRQTYKDTQKTTIGWGLLAESYANFGLLGCGGLGIVLGGAYGWLTRWSMSAPILSARSLFSTLIMTMSFQTEWTMGVYVAALFQGSVILLAFVIIFMKPERFLPSRGAQLYGFLPSSPPPRTRG